MRSITEFEKTLVAGGDTTSNNYTPDVYSDGFAGNGWQTGGAGGPSNIAITSISFAMGIGMGMAGWQATVFSFVVAGFQDYWPTNSNPNGQISDIVAP